MFPVTNAIISISMTVFFWILSKLSIRRKNIPTWDAVFIKYYANLHYSYKLICTQKVLFFNKLLTT